MSESGAETAPVKSADFAELIGKFGKGWDLGDPSLMSSIFTENARFLGDAFSRPVSGRDAIYDYWKDVPKEQADVKFRAGEVFRAGPWFSVEFKCTFRRRRTGEPVTIKGAIFCETEDGLVSEMRMYWQRKKRR